MEKGKRQRESESNQNSEATPIRADDSLVGQILRLVARRIARQLIAEQLDGQKLQNRSQRQSL